MTPGLKLASTKFDGAGSVILKWPAADCFSNGSSCPVSFANFPQLGAHRLRGAAFGAASRPFPLQRDLLGDEAVDCVGHVGEPGAAAHLAIGKNVNPDLALAGQSGTDRIVLGAAKLFNRNLPGGAARSGFQQLGRPQQAAHLFGAETWDHETAL